MKEKKDRVDDALSTTRAAIEEVSFRWWCCTDTSYRCSEGLTGESDDETTGIEIVKRAIGNLFSNCCKRR